MENITITVKEYERLKLAERLLEKLTPEGSEFYQSPQNCFDYVEECFKNNHEARIKLIRLNKELDKTI
jgi:hypothetical protein